MSAESGGPGQGATFRIELPMANPTAPSQDPAPVRPPLVISDVLADAHAQSVRGVRVLLVEDADDARELLDHLLTMHGAVVTAVPSAEVAVRWLEGHRPDVILSDVAMPGQDGREMMRTIRSGPAVALGFIPAIAITANAAPEDRDRSLASGFQAHLIKPVDVLADLHGMTVATLAVIAVEAGAPPRAFSAVSRFA